VTCKALNSLFDKVLHQDLLWARDAERRSAGAETKSVVQLYNFGSELATLFSGLALFQCKTASSSF
jgi:hypothetical protein